jgi:4-hydroxy-tetrahydrodipicolinate reductase
MSLNGLATSEWGLNSLHNLLLTGSTGKTGTAIRQEVRALADKYKILAACGRTYIEASDQKLVDTAVTPENLAKLLGNCDAVIDFSSPKFQPLLKDSYHRSSEPRPILIGTTGLEQSDQDWWIKQSSALGFPCLIAPNTSLAILIFRKILKQYTPVLEAGGYDIAIRETHHRQKKDLPSGTAKTLAKAANDLRPSSIQALRGGGNFGEHTALFMNEYDEISITHRALDRRLFAIGALKLQGWLCNQKAGFYTLDDVSPEDLL